MHDTHASVISPAATQGAPQHDEIAQCARDLWIQYGRPGDRDLAIWYEAEQRLLAATKASRVNDAAVPPPTGTPAAKPARTAERQAVRPGAPNFNTRPFSARP